MTREGNIYLKMVRVLPFLTKVYPKNLSSLEPFIVINSNKDLFSDLLKYKDFTNQSTG